MWKLTAVLAVVSSLGVLGHQGLFVYSVPRAADVSDAVRIDELREMGAALAPDALEIKEPVRQEIVHESDIPGARSGFVCAGGAPAKARATKPLHAASPAPKAPAYTPARTNPDQKWRPAFSKPRTSISTALSQNFFDKVDFGFSRLEKQTTKGKKVRTVDRTY